MAGCCGVLLLWAGLGCLFPKEQLAVFCVVVGVVLLLADAGRDGE